MLVLVILENVTIYSRNECFSFSFVFSGADLVTWMLNNLDIDDTSKFLQQFLIVLMTVFNSSDNICNCFCNRFLVVSMTGFNSFDDRCNSFYGSFW